MILINEKLKRWLVIAMLTAMTVVISILEGFIPLVIPDIKLGLANIIILIMLYEFKPYEAFLVDMVRVLIVALIKGTIASPIFFLSLFGMLASFCIMLLFSRFKGFSIVIVSILGAVFHMAGQILSLMVLIDINEVVVAIPALSLIAIGSGLITGIAARVYLKRGITAKYLDVNTVDFK